MGNLLQYTKAISDLKGDWDLGSRGLGVWGLGSRGLGSRGSGSRGLVV